MLSKNREQNLWKEGGHVMALEQLKSLRFFSDFLLGRSLRRDEYRCLWKIFMLRTVGYLSQQEGPRLTVMGLLAVGLLGTSEWAIGPSLHFSMLYLIPIMLVAWFGGIRRGVMISAVSTMTGLLVHLMSGPSHPPSSSLYQYVSLRFGIFLTVLFILSVMKTSLEDEKEVAKTDALTGVGNRRAFIEDAAAEIERARGYGGPFTVIYIDLDDLKVVNDRFGHSAGDKLMRSVAQGIRRKLRATDLIARLGGDEFGVLLSDTGREVAELIVQRLRVIGEALTKKEGCPMPFSMGVVTFLDPPGSIDEMLSTADRVMYTAKKNGKHTICREIFSKTEPQKRLTVPCQLGGKGKTAWTDREDVILDPA
jgi:diguanylate cyclase (GGDEF)-like protein